MRKIKYKEPKVMLEVRAIKERLFKEYEKLGWKGFHEKSAEVTRELTARIEKTRLAKLAGKR